MNSTITITRRTRKLGWGYTCWTKVGDTCNKPDITGTIKEIFEYVNTCKDYNNLKAGGTYLVEQWFYNGKPIEFIQDDQFLTLNDLFYALNESDFGGEYLWDSVDVKYLDSITEWGV
jgi:hypothetical protein